MRVPPGCPASTCAAPWSGSTGGLTTTTFFFVFGHVTKWLPLISEMSYVVEPPDTEDFLHNREVTSCALQCSEEKIDIGFFYTKVFTYVITQCHTC